MARIIVVDLVPYMVVMNLISKHACKSLLLLVRMFANDIDGHAECLRS